MDEQERIYLGVKWDKQNGRYCYSDRKTRKDAWIRRRKRHEDVFNSCLTKKSSLCLTCKTPHCLFRKVVFSIPKTK